MEQEQIDAREVAVEALKRYRDELAKKVEARRRETDEMEQRLLAQRNSLEEMSRRLQETGHYLSLLAGEQAPATTGGGAPQSDRYNCKSPQEAVERLLTAYPGEMMTVAQAVERILAGGFKTDAKSPRSLVNTSLIRLVHKGIAKRERGPKGKAVYGLNTQAPEPRVPARGQ